MPGEKYRGKDIGADAEDGAVAQRDHPAITCGQIEADRQNGKSRRLDDQFAGEIAADPRIKNAGRKQPDHREGFQRRLTEHLMRQPRAGKRPAGRKISTAASKA